MGCCAGHTGSIIIEERTKIESFLEKQKFKDFNTEIFDDLVKISYNKAQFSELASKYSLKIPFELLTNNVKLLKLELIIGILLFSDMKLDKKSEIFKKIIVNQRHQMMFLERRYIILYVKIPKLMLKYNEISELELDFNYLEKRLSFFQEISESYQILMDCNGLQFSRYLYLK